MLLDHQWNHALQAQDQNCSPTIIEVCKEQHNAPAMPLWEKKKKRRNRVVFLSLKPCFQQRMQALPYSSGELGCLHCCSSRAAPRTCSSCQARPLRQLRYRRHRARPQPLPTATRAPLPVLTESTRLKAASDMSVGIFTFPMPFRAY